MKEPTFRDIIRGLELKDYLAGIVILTFTGRTVLRWAAVEDCPCYKATRRGAVRFQLEEVVDWLRRQSTNGGRRQKAVSVSMLDSTRRWEAEQEKAKESAEEKGAEEKGAEERGAGE